MEEKQSEKNKTLYELYVLIDADKDEAALEQTREEMVKILEKHHANIERVSPFIKKSLAYPIHRAQFAHSGSIYFWAQPETLNSITTELQLNTELAMRTLISKVEHKITIKKQRRPALIGAALAPTPSPTAHSTEPAMLNKEKQPAERPQEQPVSSASDADSDKVTLDDIDKKLDEIMGEL